MAKQNILLVDDDHQSLRLMEVSLRKAGFAVQTARNGNEALIRIDTARPAMIIADTEMPGMDGFALCTALKSEPRTADIPFVFLTEESSVEAKVRGLELGADDYLTRPIYTRELLTRVRMSLERHKRRSLTGQHRFFGDLAEMSVVDLLQTVEIGRKSGKARFKSAGREGVIWFTGGAVANAEAGGLTGEEAVYRLLNWEHGEFEMDFRAQAPQRVVDPPIQGLLLEGMRRIDEWSRLEAQLPPLNTVVGIDPDELAEQDGQSADGRTLLDRVDGRRDLRGIIDASPLPDLRALQIINRLYFEGVLTEMEGSVAPGAIAPPIETTPPPPMTDDSVLRSSDDLITNLIQSASNQPSVTVERTAPVKAAPSKKRPAPAAKPDPETIAAPEPVSAPVAAPEPAPEPELFIAPEPVIEPDPVVAADPVAADPIEPVAAQVSPPDDDPLDAWANSSVAHDGYDDDLFADESEQGSSKAPLIALGLLVLAVGAIIAFMMRDTVEPFVPEKAKLHSGWHKTPLKARAAPTSVAAIEGDWTLPTREGGPAALVAAPASAMPAAPDSATPESAAPASAASTAAAPAVKTPAAPVSAPASKAPDTPPADGSADNGEFARLMKAGQAQAAKERYGQAASLLAKAVKLQPKNADAHLAHANALLESGKDDAALRSAKQAIRYRPSAAKAHLIIGAIYQMKGQKAAAIDAYDRFLKLAPNGRSSGEVRQILERLR